jgi:hypothetical protein
MRRAAEAKEIKIVGQAVEGHAAFLRLGHETIMTTAKVLSIPRLRCRAADCVHCNETCQNWIDAAPQGRDIGIVIG